MFLKFSFTSTLAFETSPILYTVPVGKAFIITSVTGALGGQVPTLLINGVQANGGTLGNSGATFKGMILVEGDVLQLRHPTNTPGSTHTPDEILTISGEEVNN